MLWRISSEKTLADVRENCIARGGKLKVKGRNDDGCLLGMVRGLDEEALQDWNRYDASLKYVQTPH